MKVINATLQLRGPVFIGNNQKYTKRDYVHNIQTKQVIIPQVQKMYAGIKKLRLETSYERFCMKDLKTPLGVWMKKNNVTFRDMEEWKAYSLDSGDINWEKPVKEIAACIKDAYGKPYIPGSSLKGMLRTILLSADIEKNRAQYDRLLLANDQAIRKGGRRDKFLSRETKLLEQNAFHTLEREKKKGDMVNNVLSGLIVSDSEPLEISDLTLCQKLEYHTNGETKPLPILRECLKPGTEVTFTITIDEKVCPYTVEFLQQAISAFSDTIYEHFICKFPDTDRPTEQTVWIGGGAGYLSKTVLYSLYGEQGLERAQQIFKVTLGRQYEQHKHFRDKALGVSPHILKRTRYQGKDYCFGECLLKLKERNL